ncbi:MAG TPA: hypothetical protein VFJ58_13180 [Armatimonadota bacterium]|nr:hypothetical protein [Armatimonadota bacterium]
MALDVGLVKEGWDFFNTKPPETYYTPYVYPHPLQMEGTWEELMKPAAVHGASPGSSTTTAQGSKLRIRFYRRSAQEP